MTNQITVLQNQVPADQILMELTNTKKVCESLMQLSHYKKIGYDGVYAIVQMAKTLNVDPLNCLNGGLYFQPKSGRIEMSARLMMQLIRQAGHSVTQDSKSDDTICTLHGRRKDTHDTWKASFSIADAKKAGIYVNAWVTYPVDMMYARALSRLARQLFPDVIQGCFTIGESSPTINTTCTEMNDSETIIEDNKPKLEIISSEQYDNLNSLIGTDDEYRSDVTKFIAKKYQATSLKDCPLEIYDKICVKASNRKKASEQEISVATVEEVETE